MSHGNILIFVKLITGKMYQLKVGSMFYHVIL